MTDVKTMLTATSDSEGTYDEMIIDGMPSGMTEMATVTMAKAAIDLDDELPIDPDVDARARMRAEAEAARAAKPASAKQAVKPAPAREPRRADRITRVDNVIEQDDHDTGDESVDDLGGPTATGMYANALDMLGDLEPQGRDETYEPTSPWWLSGTPLEAEHHRLMRRRPVPIPWEATTALSLTPAERARLAGTWMRRSEAEYLAITTFSVLAIDLVAAKAPADVLSLCLRAGIDEIRHAEMCIRMAEIYSGKRELPPAGMSSLPDDPARPKLHQALANTMLVSCVSETYATTVLAATREVTTDPTAQAVLTSIYSDEVMHARLGWSYLRYAIGVGGAGVIAAAAEMLPIALRGVANVVEGERPAGEITPGVIQHGLMTPADERVIFSSCVRDVLVPGFAALGIPVGTAVEDYGDAWAHA